MTSRLYRIRVHGVLGDRFATALEAFRVEREQVDLPVQILAIFGLAFRLFLAGVEIDLRQLRGRLLQIALLGYVVTLVLGLAVGAGFGLLGWIQSPLLVAITLSATSLGLVVPVLKDARQADGVTGQLTIASSSVADFAAILLLTLFFWATGGSIGEKASLLVIFAALGVTGGALLLRVRHSVRLGGVLTRLQDTTAEIRVRGAVLLLVGLVAWRRTSAWRSFSVRSWPARWSA